MAQPRKVNCCIYYDCSLFVVVVVVGVALSSESEDIGTYPLEFFEPVFRCGFVLREWRVRYIYEQNNVPNMIAYCIPDATVIEPVKYSRYGVHSIGA